eukprot:COSAG01_NODE_66222_length_270_cov_69.801170_2_plen_57_part_01
MFVSSGTCMYDPAGAGAVTCEAGAVPHHVCQWTCAIYDSVDIQLCGFETAEHWGAKV